MAKSGIIATLATFLVVLVSGFLSEICCLASPLIAVFLGLGAGFLYAVFEKPADQGTAVQRGATTGAIAGIAAVLAQIVGQILFTLIVHRGGTVEIAPLGLPITSATVGMGNWLLEVLLTSFLYGLITLMIMAGLGALGGILWFRVSGKKNPAPSAAADFMKADQSHPNPLDSMGERGKMVLAGAIAGIVSFVFFLLLAATWGCMEQLFAILLGAAAGIMAGMLCKPQTVRKAAVSGGITGAIGWAGSIPGSISGILIRTFFTTTPEGINSMAQGLYDFMGMANAKGARTPVEILKSDIPITCFCSALDLLFFVGLGVLGGILWFRWKNKNAVPPPTRGIS
jgi:MFS family permease